MSDMKRYSTMMVFLHWLLAIVILAAIFLGAVVLDEMDSEHPQKILLLKTHILIGAGILLLTLLRLVLRFTTPQPAPLAGSKQWLEKISTMMHYLLYLLTIFTALSGVTLAVSADLPAVLLNHVGVLPGDYEDFIAHEAHDIFANLLLLAIILHALAALYHQFILKDGLLSRMYLRKERK